MRHNDGRKIPLDDERRRLRRQVIDREVSLFSFFCFPREDSFDPSSVDLWFLHEISTPSIRRGVSPDHEVVQFRLERMQTATTASNILTS